MYHTSRSYSYIITEMLHKKRRRNASKGIVTSSEKLPESWQLPAVGRYMAAKGDAAALNAYSDRGCGVNDATEVAYTSEKLLVEWR